MYFHYGVRDISKTAATIWLDNFLQVIAYVLKTKFCKYIPKNTKKIIRKDANPLRLSIVLSHHMHRN